MTVKTKLTFPASRLDMIPLLATKQSAKVVLPAKTEMVPNDFTTLQLTGYVLADTKSV